MIKLVTKLVTVHMCYSKYKHKVKVALATGLLLFACPAFSTSYLIVHFTNQYNGFTPQWIGLYGTKQWNPNTPLHLSARIRKRQHPRILTNPAVIKVNSGIQRFDHIDFTKHKRGDENTLRFKKLYETKFKRNAVYYTGDITFSEGGISSKPSLDTIRILCKKSDLVRSAEAIYLLLQGPKPIKIDAPCARLELPIIPAIELNSDAE